MLKDKLKHIKILRGYSSKIDPKWATSNLADRKILQGADKIKHLYKQKGTETKNLYKQT